MDALRNSKEDSYQLRYQEERRQHWDGVARLADPGKGHGRAYHKNLEKLYAFIIPAGKKVLEVGCAQGDLLAAVRPVRGVGVDFLQEMIQQAKNRHPELHLVCADAHEISSHLDESSDAIILSDLVNDLWNVRQVLAELARLAMPGTRIILNFFSKLWEFLLRVVRNLVWQILCFPKTG